MIGLLFLIAFVLFCFGWGLRKRIGRVKDTSFETYWNTIFEDQAPEDKNDFTDFFAGILYPFWSLLYLLLEAPPGSPDHTLPPPPPSPPPPPPPITAEDLNPLADEACMLMLKALPNLPANLVDAISETMRDLLAKEYEGRPPDQIDKAAVIVLLADAFWKFFSQFPQGEGRLMSTIYFVVRPAQIEKFFCDLSPRFKQTYERLWRTIDWGNFLTSRKADSLQMRQIGERDSPAHAEYLLRQFPYLQNVKVPIPLPNNKRFEGTWVIAPPGRGKTTLLSALLKDDLEEVKAGKASVIIFDSKGDLIQHARELAEVKDKITLIEPSSDLAINPIKLGATTGHTIDLLEYSLISLLGNDPTPNQLLLLRKLIMACLAIPDATVMTMRDILLHGWTKYESHILAADELTAEWFKAGQFDTMRETRQALATKIEDLITRVDLLKGMFRSPSTKIDMAKLMDAPGLVVIDNSVARLTNSGSTFFGRFFIALILAAAQQRSGRRQDDKLPVYVYIDEAQTVIADDPTVAKIVETCRSQKIAMTFAHQALSQIKSPEVQSALANCAIRMANPDADASALADDFRVEVDFLRGMNQGVFALFVRDYTPFTIKIAAPDEPVWTWPKMSTEEFADLRARMGDLYTFTAEPPREPEPAAPAYDTEAGARG